MTTTFNAAENGGFPRMRLSADFEKGGVDIWLDAIRFQKFGEHYTCYAIGSGMEGNAQWRKDPKDYKSGDYKWQMPKDYKFAFTVSPSGEKISDVEKAVHKLLGNLEEGKEYKGKLSLSKAHNPLGIINGCIDAGGVSVPLAPEAIAALGKVICGLTPSDGTLITEELKELKVSSGSGYNNGGGGGQKAADALKERLEFALDFLTKALPEEAAIETPKGMVDLFISPNPRASAALDALKYLLGS
jgi:hypothetical protein